MAEFSREWLFARYVRDEELRCPDQAPRLCRGLDGVMP